MVTSSRQSVLDRYPPKAIAFARQGLLGLHEMCVGQGFRSEVGRLAAINGDLTNTEPILLVWAPAGWSGDDIDYFASRVMAIFPEADLLNVEDDDAGGLAMIFQQV